MTDKELLELAAKAAGVKVPTKKDYPYAYIDERGIHKDISCGGDGTRMSLWNPLVNDGDALRLAVKLKIGSIEALRLWAAVDCEAANSAYEIDPYAATRRAIVRAAAELGRNKT